MAILLPISVGAVLLVVAIYRFIVEPLYTGRLSKIPGPRSYALSKWRLAWDEYRGHRTRAIHSLHARYRPVVRIGPNEVHFNTPSALRTIYGAGSGFARTDFYRMFDAYGKQNVFTFGPSSQHAERKKLLASAYAKGSMIRGRVAEEVESKVEDYLKLIENSGERGDEIFRSLHYFSLDNITNFLYGPDCGGTAAMKGDREHQALLDDILDPDRRKLTWCVVHFPSVVRWLYTRTGWIEKLVAPILPMQKPSTYTRIRAHALKSMQDYKKSVQQGQVSEATKDTVVDRLWKHHQDGKKGGLDDLDVAAEASDHLLAGIDTTSDTLMFLIWALSRPENKHFQDKLTREARSISEADLNEAGNPTLEAADKLPCLDAVIKETLRLYAPLPASEPRSPPKDTTIDGYHIPAGTTVSMAPYSLHRNRDVFPNPLKWDPERWLTDDTAHLTEMKRWWWAFSSGGRMCIGMHLAMAEMVALVPAIYRKYETSIKEGFEDVTPGITSRFEVFYDERFEKIEPFRDHHDAVHSLSRPAFAISALGQPVADQEASDALGIANVQSTETGIFPDPDELESPNVKALWTAYREIRGVITDLYPDSRRFDPPHHRPSKDVETLQDAQHNVFEVIMHLSNNDVLHRLPSTMSEKRDVEAEMDDQGHGGVKRKVGKHGEETLKWKSVNGKHCKITCKPGHECKIKGGSHCKNEAPDVYSSHHSDSEGEVHYDKIEESDKERKYEWKNAEGHHCEAKCKGDELCRVGYSELCEMEFDRY